MKNKTIHMFFNIIFSFSIFLTIFTQSTDAKNNAFDLANSFFEKGNYEEAIIEYMRFIYFNPDTKLVSEAYYNIGMVNREQKKWSEAVEAIRKSISCAYDDSIRDERRISIAIIMITAKEYNSAELELLRVFHFTDYSVIKKEAAFFLGVCRLYTFRWKESQEAFFLYNSGSMKNKSNEIDSLYALSSNLHYKSPRVAKWLSTFLPGSGQIYCNDWRNGINSLALNSLTFYFLINSLLEHRFQNTFITFLTPFERYYRGNRFHAERIAILYNENINKILAKNILDHLYQNLFDMQIIMK